MHFSSRKFISFIICLSLLLAVLIFLIVQSTPYYNDLSPEDRIYVYNLAKNITANASSDLEKITSLMHWSVDNIEHKAYINHSEFNLSHSPSAIISRGWGLCFDRSYLFELMVQSLGYPARHIAITDGIGSHAISEVKIGKNWVLFDTTYDKYYTNDLGNPLSLKELHARRYQLITEYNPDKMRYVIYGTNSFHGMFFKPKIPFPDINLKQFLYNIYILPMLPYTFKNLHYYFSLTVLLLIIIIILILYKKSLTTYFKR